MKITTILTVLDGSSGANVALKAAIGLAKRFGARLDLLAVAPPASPLLATAAYTPEAYGAAMDAGRAAAEATLKDGAALVEAAGLPFETALLGSPLSSIQEAVATRGLVADLIVAAQNGRSRDVTRRVIDGALFSAPAPLLVWPEDVDPAAAATLGARPTLAWDARPQAARAARLALPLIREAEAIAVTCVIHDYGDEPYEDEPGEPFLRWLERQGLSAALRQLEADDVADALLADAAERRSDVIVMGGYGHTQLREAIFGGVTETLLRSSPAPLFLAH